MRMKTVVITLLGVLPLMGCEANQLYVGIDTIVGVNAKVSPDRQSGDLTIGYDRDFAAVVPKSVDKENGNGNGEEKDAMSALVCSEVRVSGIFLSGFTEAVATGEAAQIFAMRASDGQMVEFFSCFDEVKAKGKNSNPAVNKGNEGGTTE